MKRNLQVLPIYIGVSLMLLFMAVACKPTEKNYRAAYEAAQRKEQGSMADMGVSAPLQSDDHLSRRTIGGVEVWVSHELLRGVAVDGCGYSDADLKGKYGVAEALYRMRTNAMSHAGRLNAEGGHALLATDGSERWYVVTRVCDNMRQAAVAADSINGTLNGRKLPGLPAPAVVSMR